MRILRGAIGRPCADEAAGELVHVNLAQQNGACVFEEGDDEGGSGGDVRERGTGGGCGVGRGVDVILDDVRYSMEWKLSMGINLGESVEGFLDSIKRSEGCKERGRGGGAGM